MHAETREILGVTERVPLDAPAYRVRTTDPAGRYSITKGVLVGPLAPCLLLRTRLEGDPDLLSRLRLYVLCAPHLKDGGCNTNASVVEIAGRRILVAEKEGTWLALAATAPFARVSCGYVGRSDGWTDLHEHRRMQWELDEASDGNVTLTGELEGPGPEPFTLGLAFGTSLHHAATTLLTSLGLSYVDLPVRSASSAPLRFTFFWIDQARWEGTDYAVAIDKR